MSILDRCSSFELRGPVLPGSPEPDLSFAGDRPVTDNRITDPKLISEILKDARATVGPDFLRLVSKNND